jgi:pilus assembly protein Flp/PilA
MVKFNKREGLNMFNELYHDDSGASAVEYGLIAALVGVAIITATTFMGGRLRNLFNRIGNAIV